MREKVSKSKLGQLFMVRAIMHEEECQQVKNRSMLYMIRATKHEGKSQSKLDH